MVEFECQKCGCTWTGTYGKHGVPLCLKCSSAWVEPIETKIQKRLREKDSRVLKKEKGEVLL